MDSETRKLLAEMKESLGIRTRVRRKRTPEDRAEIISDFESLAPDSPRDDLVLVGNWQGQDVRYKMEDLRAPARGHDRGSIGLMMLVGRGMAIESSRVPEITAQLEARAISRMRVAQPTYKARKLLRSQRDSSVCIPGHGRKIRVGDLTARARAAHGWEERHARALHNAETRALVRSMTPPEDRPARKPRPVNNAALDKHRTKLAELLASMGA